MSASNVQCVCFSFSPQDPYDLAKYRDNCTFLPDINNERPIKKKEYADRIKSLNLFVLIYSTMDKVCRICMVCFRACVRVCWESSCSSLAPPFFFHNLV